MKITLLAGDGIGPEVMDAALKVLRMIEDKLNLRFEKVHKLFGGCSYDVNGVPLTDEVLEECMRSDVILLAAVGGKIWDELPHDLKPEAGLLKIRKSLDLYANIRPAKPFKALLDNSLLKREGIEGVDFLICRELTSGIYFGQPRGYDEERGWNTMLYNKEEVLRVVRKAFEIARNRRKKIVSVDKANVLECSQFWRNIVNKVADEFPDVSIQHMLVDNAAMQIVREPRQFDVIVTANLFGDILSDIAGMVAGSIGMLPSASIGDRYALYEPVHGSAPDIAGQNKANPVGMILSVAMMFEYSLKMSFVASTICNAIEEVLNDGYRTADIALEGAIVLGTREFTDVIIERLNKNLTNENIYKSR